VQIAIIMRILITGGAGFVGSSLASAFKLEDPSNDVVILDNLRRRGSELNLPRFKQQGISFVHGDIRNSSDLEDLDGDFDLFLEASAEPSVHAGMNGSPQYVLQTNLAGTLNCLEFARRRASNFIFLSTSRVYSIGPLRELSLVESPTRFLISETESGSGISARGIIESFPTDGPRSLYGATKLSSELIIQEYAFAYGLPTIINRCGVLAGPGQFGKVDQGVFTLWVANHFFQKPLRYTGFGGEGKQVRDLLHPLDLFSLIKRELTQIEKYSGQTFNVGGGPEISTSLLELTAICQEIVGNKVPITKEAETAAVDIPFYVSDYSKAAAAFDWKPQRSVAVIVEDIFRWIKDNETALKAVFN
jgi:CDP-paratose 2-epimerase